MEKSRKPHTILSFLFERIGKRGRSAIVHTLAARANRRLDFHFPNDLQGATKILIVLPSEPLAALLQVSTVVSLLSHFKNCEAVLLCEKNMPAFFKSIHGIGSIIQYDRQESFLFSREHTRLAREITHAGFDVCFYLDRQEDLDLLYLVAKTHARIRIGLESAGGADFLNFRIRSSLQGRHLSEQSLQLCTVIGIKPVKSVKWVIPKETTNEIEHLLAEAAIPKGQALAGIDAASLYAQCGGEWLMSLVKELERRKELHWYFFGEGTPSAELLGWLKSTRRPVFWGLSSSRLAALIHRSALILSGRAPVFEMAFLLGTRGIGVFEAHDLPLYCRATPLSQGVEYSQSADEKTRQRLIDLLFPHAPAAVMERKP